ncbi:MAG: hypothetical protein K8R48_07900 [Alphaproteobacteria bacterium]|nr:hypothetical protein [Alphaproteobacteria bacterium]
MTDKKTKKEIKQVILKYLGKDNDYASQKTIGLLGGPVVALGMGMDLLLTGGLFSMGTLCLGTFGIAMGTAGGGYFFFNSRKKSRTNDAGQTFKCAAPVNDTLEEMESKLQKSFKKASSQTASQKLKEQFRFLATEIEQDVKKLSPAFKIVSGGPFNTEKYEFIVDKKKLLTLTQALRELDQPPAPEKPTPQEQKIKELEARINELENPKIARLDKKPNNPPSP